MKKRAEIKGMDKFEKALEMSDEDFLRRFGYSKKENVLIKSGEFGLPSKKN